MPIRKEQQVDNIVKMYSQSRKYYKPMRENWTKSYKQYMSYLDLDTMKDYYKWRSKLFIPATAKAVDGFIPDILLALFEPKPFFEVKPAEMNDVGPANAIQPLLEYQFDCANFKMQFYDFIKQLALYGTTFGKVFWKHEEGKKIIKVPLMDPMGGPVLDEKGKPVIDKQEEIEVYFDGPVFETIDIFNISVSQQAMNLDDTWVIQRSERTIGEMKKMDIYENVDKLESYIAETKTDGRYEELVRQQIKGLTTPFSDEEGDDRKVELLEYWTKDRTKTMTIAGQSIVVRPERDNPIGIDPFIGCNLWGNPKELFGTGVPEKCRDIQDQLNTEVNQRLDNRNLRQNLIFKVKRGANINVRNLVSRPGNVWLTDEMEALEVITLPDTTSPYSFQEQGMLEQKCEEVTGVTKYSTGAGSGSTRTATEASILTRMSSKSFALHLLTIEEMALKPILMKFFKLDKKFMDAEKVVRIVGEAGYEFQKITPDNLQMAGDPDFTIVGASQLVDKNMKVQQMLQMLQIVAQDPSINRGELVKRIWEAWGYKDFNTLVAQQMGMPGMPPSPQGQPGMPPQSQGGMPVPPTDMRMPSPQEGVNPMMMGGGGIRPNATY